MAKGSRKSGPENRQAILDAASGLLRERRTGDVTIEEVAKRAGCAKGLVHYHFKRKDQLLAASATSLWDRRARTWGEALNGPDPRDAIGAAWTLLRGEASDGTAAACTALGLRKDDLVVQSVNAGRGGFGKAVTHSLEGLLARMRLAPTVPASELGTLLAATAEGISMQLGSGAAAAELEQAWAAFWVGLLSLTREGRF